MFLAKVVQGKILQHFEGTESDINLVPDEQNMIVAPMPDWAIELRLENLRTKVAERILKWNYSTNEFDITTFEPNWQESLEQSLDWVRQKRNSLLDLTDKYVNPAPDREVDEEVKNELITYRQQLRDLPSNEVFANANTWKEECETLGQFAKTEHLFPEHSEKLEGILREELDKVVVIDLNKWGKSEVLATGIEPNRVE
jgi:hypothetical protein